MNSKYLRRYLLLLSLPLVYIILLYLGLRQGGLFRDNLNREIDRTVKNYGFPVYRIIQDEYEFLDFISEPPLDSEDFSSWDSLISYLNSSLSNLGDNSEFIVFAAAVSEDFGINVVKDSPAYTIEKIMDLNRKSSEFFDFLDENIVIRRKLGKKSSFLVYTVIDFRAVYEKNIIPKLKVHFSQEDLRFEELDHNSTDNRQFLREEPAKLTFRDILLMRKEARAFLLPAVHFSGPGVKGSNMFNYFKPDRGDRDKVSDFDKNIPNNFIYRKLTFYIDDKSLLHYTIDRVLFSVILNLLLVISLSLLYTLIVLQILKISRIRQKEKEFVSAITHELRTPLTVIHNAGDNMRQGIISGDRVIKYGNLIVQQGRRLGDMIESILLFSNLENKSVPESLREETVLSEWFKEFRGQMDSLASAEGYSLNWDYAETSLVLLFSRGDVELILSNLISNALKHAYIKKEKSQIRIKMTMSLPESLIFIVEDDGDGISKQDKKRVFKAFERGRESREAQKKGTGLGLHIARKKAENIQGKLILESPYSRMDESVASGCRFTLIVPVKNLLMPVEIKRDEKENSNGRHSDN